VRRTNVLGELPFKLGDARTLAHPSAAKHLEHRRLFFFSNEWAGDWNIFS
jgi:hypothetical protein